MDELSRHFTRTTIKKKWAVAKGLARCGARGGLRWHPTLESSPERLRAAFSTHPEDQTDKTPEVDALDTVEALFPRASRERPSRRRSGECRSERQGQRKDSKTVRSAIASAMTQHASSPSAEVYCGSQSPSLTRSPVAWLPSTLTRKLQRSPTSPPAFCYVCVAERAEARERVTFPPSGATRSTP